MDRYKDYMDHLEVSDTLHEKLKNLEEPQKKPPLWVKWGAMAAVMALIVGAGAWGLSRFARNDGLGETVDLPAIGNVDVGREDIPAPFPDPDIAIVNPNDPYAPPDRTNAGYEIVDGEMTAYYFLPYLEWADAYAYPQNSMDYVLAPPDAVSREMTWDDVLLFMGGEKAMADHLLWDGLDWGGTVWFADELTPCAALLYAEGNGMSLTLEVMLGGEVPSCVVLPEEYYKTSRWQGAKITALEGGGHMVGDDGVELINKREVSLLYANHVGYKLTLYADDARAYELCARFVRYAVDGGFHLYALSDEPIYEEDLPDEDGGSGYVEPFPAVPDAAPQTTPYDPNMTAEAKTPTPPN